MEPELPEVADAALEDAVAEPPVVDSDTIAVLAFEEESAEPAFDTELVPVHAVHNVADKTPASATAANLLFIMVHTPNLVVLPRIMARQPERNL